MTPDEIRAFVASVEPDEQRRLEVSERDYVGLCIKMADYMPTKHDRLREEKIMHVSMVSWGQDAVVFCAKQHSGGCLRRSVEMIIGRTLRPVEQEETR